MIEVKDGYLSVDGRALPLLAGEFHYWRNERRDWPEILDRIVEAGFTVVTSFVQWNVHEYEPGKFDFTGERASQLDIPAFLELAKERGLYVHLRPGPACCEWRVSGATSFGTPWMECFDEFWKVVEPYQVSAGGALLLLQIQNEWFEPVGFYKLLEWAYIGDYDGFHAPPVPYWLETGTIHPHYLSAGEDFDWRYLGEFFRYVYPSVNSLNAAWESDFSSFDAAVDHVRDLSNDKFAGLVDYLHRESESERFARGNIARVLNLSTWSKLYMAFPLRKYIDQGRERSSTLITHNWPMITERTYNSIAGLDLSGYDLYQPTWANPWEWVLQTSELQNNKLPYSAEFMCGTIAPYMWGGQGKYDPGFARLSILGFFANGLRAINLYMLVERDNWCHCPIDERGKTRPSYHAVSSIMRGLRELEWHKAERKYDLFILRHSPYQHCAGSTQQLFPRNSFSLEWLQNGPYTGIDVMADFHDLTVELHEAGIDFSSADTGDGEWPDLRGRSRVSALSLPFMQREFAERLVKVAQSGGKVLIYPWIPERDEFGRPMDMLTKVLGTSVSESTDTDEVSVKYANGASALNALGARRVQIFHADAEMEVCAETSHGACGFVRKVGDGEIIVLGFQPSEFSGSAEGVYSKLLGCRSYAGTTTPLSDASAVISPSGDPAVIVYNGNSDEPVNSVRLHNSLGNPGEEYRVWNVLEGQPLGTVRWGESDVDIPLTVPPRDATMIRLVPPGKELTPRPVPSLAGVTVSEWRMRRIGIDKALKPSFAVPEYSDWVEVDSKEWTLPAIASGKTFGVQGWFRLTQQVELPEAEGPVSIRISPYGWGNILSLHVNGMECGRMFVERPGIEASFDVTGLVKPGTNQIAVRVYRQSTDCHDLGACGFERFVVQHGGGDESIDRWMLAQEHPDFAPAHDAPSAADAAEFPLNLRLRKDGEAAWLYGTLHVSDAPTEACIGFRGENACVTVFVNGEYTGETPYLPVELPLYGLLKPGENRIALRVSADILAAHTLPREDRHRFWIVEGMDQIDLRLDEVAVLVGR